MKVIELFLHASRAIAAISMCHFLDVFMKEHGLPERSLSFE
jgi:hypothetical protein